MKKIEILFPKVCSLYGEIGSINYLKRLLKEQEISLCPFDEEPLFASEDVDFIFLGAMSEKWQIRVIEKLMPYRDRLKELIENGTMFLTIACGYELFGKYIQAEDGSKMDALGIFDYHAVQDFSRRYNQKMILDFDGKTIVAVKSQFSHVYGVSDDEALMKCIKGAGNNPASTTDGFRYKNFYGTQLLGPIMLCNTEFTKHILEKLGLETDSILYEDLITASHKARYKYTEAEKKA